MAEIVFLILEAVLKACQLLLAVMVAAFLSHLIDPEPIPQVMRWPRRAGRTLGSLPRQDENKTPRDGPIPGHARPGESIR